MKGIHQLDSIERSAEIDRYNTEELTTSLKMIYHFSSFQDCHVVLPYFP